MSKANKETVAKVDYTDKYPTFTDEMKKTHTILIPNMLPWHFGILMHVFEQYGYRLEMLENESRVVIDEGLKHVHNDTCYPALCVIGQFIDALKSGKYDLDKTAVLISQSGGGCRASNYIPLIRKALKAEFPQVPVMSFNFSGLEKGNGIKITPGLLLKLGYGVFYGDVLMSLYNQCKPYETEKGAAERARDEAIALIYKIFDEKKELHLQKNVRSLLALFSSVARTKEVKPKVGIVGEIYVKYSPLGNSRLEEFLLSEGCEPVVPALTDFVLYCIVNNINDAKYYGRGKKSAIVYKVVYKWLYSLQKKIIRLFKKQGEFEPPHDFEALRRHADEVIHQGVKMGEGWLIPAEMAALAESGTENVVCAQPFGCLPNHIAGKGATRAVKQKYPNVNVVAIDYDPSATKVNQENRIKLMLATAKERLIKND